MTPEQEAQFMTENRIDAIIKENTALVTITDSENVKYVMKFAYKASKMQASVTVKISDSKFLTEETVLDLLIKEIKMQLVKTGELNE